MKLMFEQRISFLIPMLELYMEETFFIGMADDVYENVDQAMDNFCQKYIEIVANNFYQYCLDNRIEFTKTQILGLREFCNDASSEEEVVNTMFVYWIMYKYTSIELCMKLFF